MIEIHIEKTCPQWWDKEPFENRDFFQSSLWGKYLETSKGRKPFYIYAVKNNRIVGSLLAYYSSLRFKRFYEGGGIIANIPSIRWHHGPLLRSANDLEVARELIEAAINIKKIKLKVKGEAPYIHQPEISCLYPQIAEKVGTRCYKWATYLVETSAAINVIWNRLKSEARTSIRKLQKLGFQTSWLSREDLDKYLTLLKKHRAHNKLNLPPFYPDSALCGIMNENSLKIACVLKEGEIVSAWPIITYNQICRFLAAAHSPELTGRERSVNDLAQWAIIEYANKEKLKYYDLAGVAPEPNDKKEEGIKFFKAKWGGKYIEYFVLEK